MWLTVLVPHKDWIQVSLKSSDPEFLRSNFRAELYSANLPLLKQDRITRGAGKCSGEQ